MCKIDSFGERVEQFGNVLLAGLYEWCNYMYTEKFALIDQTIKVLYDFIQKLLT